MTEIHGVTGAPYKTPQVRRKLPTPHSRPRIDLDGGRRVKRAWKDLSVLEVRPGDTVAGFGVVTHRSESVDTVASFDHGSDRLAWRIRLINALGVHRDFPGEQRVYAFTVDG